MCIVQNIIFGIISGVLATLITNAVNQYFTELRTINKIQRRINEYIDNLEKYKNTKSPTDIAKEAYIEINNLFDAVYADVNEQTASLVLFKRKSDEIMFVFANIYNKNHDEKKFDILFCINQLENLREQL